MMRTTTTKTALENKIKITRISQTLRDARVVEGILRMVSYDRFEEKQEKLTKNVQQRKRSRK